MNRIISLFLFIFVASCLNAQYNTPIRNKVTLGKQTTADGLVWRGQLADTANLLTNKLDTSVYIVLDTGTRAMWYYSASTTPKWTRLVDSLNNLQGQLSLTSKVTGTLPVANGGTGQTTLAAAGIVTGTGTTNYLPKFTSASAIGNSNLFNDTSGNVGIGITSPASRFHIKQSADAHSGGLKLERFSGTNTYSLNIDANNNLNLGYATTASTSTNRLVIDANGNVGVGITPSAWRNIFTAFQFGLTGSFYALIPSFNAEEMNFASNYYQDSDGLERRIINGYTERLRLKSGRFEFDAAGFGLSNSVISFNRRLLIDSTGNVGIGTTSPTARLQVKGSTNALEFALKVDDNSNNNLLSVQNNGATTFTGSVTANSLSLTTPLSVANGGTGENMSSLPNNYLVRKNSSGVFDTASIFEANGNVGINVIPSAWGSQFKAIESGDNNNQSAVTFNTGANGLNFFANAFFDGSNTKYKYNGFATRFVTADGKYEYYNTPSGNSGNNITWTEVMTIDASGNLGINQPNPTEKLHVVGNARITAMNGINDIGASATGVLQAATSDINLKNTIENSPFGLNEILLLNPVTFLYNDENRKIDSDVKEVGFIAQDVFDVIPNAVSSTGTGDLQLDYRAITAALVKAIQEQTIIIKQLEDRILTLENK